MPKEVQYAKDLKVTIVDSPIPKPGPGQLTVRVVVAASNPKDWKCAVWEMVKGPFNHGDDFAGYVHETGPGVLNFKKGDRVAAFHEMLSPHGDYAEYAIAPVQTTFHIPEKISFEEAVTITLPAYTAAIGLTQKLGLPAPWEGRKRSLPETPLIVYGGATAVGAFVIKLAKLASIGPIITVVGKSSDYVKTLLGPEDKIVDYRGGNVAEKIKDALGGKEAHYAYDAVAEGSSWEDLSAALTAPAQLTHVLPQPQGFKLPEGIKAELTRVGDAHTKDAPETWDFTAAVSTFFERALADGRLSGHPTEVLGGLDKVEEGMKLLQEGKVSAKRLVYKIGEE